MAWLYEKSALWRKIVFVTRESPAAFAAFTAIVGVGIPYLATDAIIRATNPEMALDTERVKQMKQRQGIEHEMLARVNKQRLQTLLDEVKNNSSNEDRYKASLDGRTLGTSSGTSKPE